MEEENKILWWGYKHSNGSIQVKRYFDKRDLDEAEDSPFCDIIIRQFPAKGRDEAIAIVTERLNHI